MMVNPGEILVPAEFKHKVERKCNVANHNLVMFAYFVIRNFHIMIQAKKLSVGINASYNGGGAFSVIIRNVVDT